MSEEETPSQTVKALPMRVPEELLRRNAERKRVKKGVLEESDETRVFEKTLYLPYLDFTYQYPTTKGLFSKQFITGNGRSVVVALREIDLGFYPELVAVVPQLTELNPASLALVEGVDSTVLVQERLDDLKRILSEYDRQLDQLREKYSSFSKTDDARQDLKDSIDRLKRTRERRWKMFADGLKLPSIIDLEKLELVEGSLFYMPYFVVKFVRSGESRFLVWNREGKEEEPVAEELRNNSRFRELVEDRA